MSVRVMTAVWSLDLPDSQKIVLLALADSANDEGHCWPSMASLVRKCSKSERTIQGVVKELVSAGHLTRQEVPGKGCNYYLHPRSGCAPAEVAPAQGAVQTPAAAADKPSRTINNGLADAKPKRMRKPAAEPVVLPDWMPVEKWGAYLKMRTAKGAKPTDDGERLLIGKLDRWRAQGHDPGAILDASTENNWTGLFEPKAARNDRSSASNDQHQNPYVRAALEREAERTAAFG